jgi:DNA polymerase-1
MAEKFNIIKTLEGLKDLKEYLKDQEYISFDTETTGLDKDSTVIGFSVCSDLNVAHYVILHYWDTNTKNLVPLETQEPEALKDFILFLSTKSLIGHNSPFDARMIKNNFGVNLMPSFHTDTQILAHLLDENRRTGLKELGSTLFGEDATKEQKEMKESIVKNGGVITKDNYELYKADADLIAKYGAKDALLTLKLFYELVPKLYEEKLDKFFYEDESMPLLRGPTYELNEVGLKVDLSRLQTLRATLETECHELKAFVYKEVFPHVKDKYPGTGKSNTFNIGSGQQLAWLLFHKLGNEFGTLTDEGRNICQCLNIKVPYSPLHKGEFLRICKENKGNVYEESKWNTKTKKMAKPKKVGDPWKYLSADAETLSKFSNKYKWVASYLEYAKKQKILNTYVIGIQERQKYGIIHPSFLQTGTTSGRYSSRDPNFQNLPRDDKRIKECIISRPGKVFVGADFSQLEPRCFASVSQDPTLLDCFAKGEDFYSVVGKPIFNKNELSAFKKDSNSFAEKHPELRNIAKQFALATPYGTSAFQQSVKIKKSREECQTIIDKYFASYPKVELMMLESHEMAKKEGVVYSVYGRPRRMPEAKDIPDIYGNVSHSELPYVARNLLNLAMNHRIQSTAASVTNRSAIKFYENIRLAGIEDCNLVLQVHDELVAECLEKDTENVVILLQDAMQEACTLPGVELIAEPKVAKNLADLK